MAGAAPAFHLARAARDRLRLGDLPGDARGDLAATDLLAIRRLATRLNAARLPDAAPILPGQLAALVILHELGHLVIARLEADRPGRAIEAANRALTEQLGPARAGALLDAFGEAFPPPAGTPRETPPARLAELVLIRVANENPASEPFRELFDDRPLTRVAGWAAALGVLEATLGPVEDAGAGDPLAVGLLAILRAPASHAPTSLAGQLRYTRAHWAAFLGQDGAAMFRLVDQALAELAEEAAALARGFGGHAAGAVVEVPRLSDLDEIAERFSADADWMPGVVLQARSTYVWLDQLSGRYGREIATLDAIPDDELERLARWGINSLWLIGVWERSKASQLIKHRRGNPDALASAYAIDDYVVAAELGGEAALARLRDRASAHGIRLACDMVPNHMGIDSRWLIGRPDWFLSVPEPPYPAYTFDGPDLSPDPGVSITLEDHYWDGSDAAVVFRRRDTASGETRFVYHGNDGTSLPWNDTAQLDFLQAEVREQVIRTILDVARRFPVIRFDAAMVLARRHVRRLWWPEPGTVGGVPSRGAHPLPQAEFDRRMPVEFWREVVDRVAAEVPGTLLLAEAFWLLEGYFVRTLGMHRVYNSAFMHMLRDEDMAGYRRLIRETIEFDPEILERYVNFMSNPDEATAVEQFGRGDKHFGAATILATMPGLPMLGHGQVEGFGEKYGMEFRRAGWGEEPDMGMIERHEREIAPLLRDRRRFSRAADFRLYDLVRDDGTVDERVLAYSNGRGDARSLVVYLGVFGDTAGWLRDSATFAVKDAGGAKHLTRQALAEALELPGEPNAVVAYRDGRSGEEYLRAVGEVRERGLWVRLGAYECQVLDQFRVLPAGTGRWLELAGRLDHRAVPSLDEALRDLELEPLHDRLRELFEAGHVAQLAAALAPRLDDEAGIADPRVERARDAVAAFAGELSTADGGDPNERLAAIDAARARIDGALELARTGAAGAFLNRSEIRHQLVTAIAVGTAADDGHGPAHIRERFDRCRLRRPLSDALRSGLADGSGMAAAERIRAVIGLPGSGLPAAAGRYVAATWVLDPVVRETAGGHWADWTEWIVQESWEALVDLWALVSVAASTTTSGADEIFLLARHLKRAAKTTGYRVDRIMQNGGLSVTERDLPPGG